MYRQKPKDSGVHKQESVGQGKQESVGQGKQIKKADVRLLLQIYWTVVVTAQKQFRKEQ
jgi:hypothetical protein